jgi:hypothetical protein
MLIKKQSYATSVNSRYSNTASHYVSLHQRLTDALNASPILKQMFQQVIAEFKRRNPHIKKFKDLKLVRAIPINIKDLIIDTTIQRPLDLTHVFEILNYFSEVMIQSLCVYQNDEKNKMYIIWDGQHTALVLYILITYVFGESLDKIELPVNISSSKQKLEIRRNHILLNGSAKKSFEPIDYFQQHLYGVKVDGSKDPYWIDSAKINDLFEDAGIFATNKNFGDENEIGAHTLLAGTIWNKHLDKRKPVEVTRMFCDYWKTAGHKRHVDAKESRLLYEFFYICLKDKIKIDQQWISEFVAVSRNLFDLDWSENSLFWAKVSLAYDIWYEKTNPEAFKEYGVKGYVPEPRFGIPFLIEQLKKSSKIKTPKFISSNGFYVKKDCLF